MIFSFLFKKKNFTNEVVNKSKKTNFITVQHNKLVKEYRRQQKIKKIKKIIKKFLKFFRLSK